LTNYLRDVIIDNIQNLNNLTDYKILVRLDMRYLILKDKILSYYGDIRFKDSDSNILLNYYIELNKCNTNNTKIWVKFLIIL